MSNRKPKDDGGPAFPSAVWIGDRGETKGGLTVRDWFAGMALAGMCASDEVTKQAVAMGGPESHFARWAYEQADAMIAERTNAEEASDE